jgi:PPOX class probable F420-dependent enzyme
MEEDMLDLTKERDAHIDERLRRELMMWLSTVRPDGRPHLVPVWFLWDGETILIFSQPKQQKLRNLQHNPNVVVALDTAGQGDDVVMMEGKAELLDDPKVSTALPAYAEKYKERLELYGWSGESMAQDYSQAIRITPTKFFK